VVEELPMPPSSPISDSDKDLASVMSLLPVRGLIREETLLSYRRIFGNIALTLLEKLLALLNPSIFRKSIPPSESVYNEDTDPSSELKSVAETFPSEFSFALAMNELEERE
jgi:hypothetical protein